MIPPTAGQTLDRPSGGGLADVVELILDKGLVIDVSTAVLPLRFGTVLAGPDAVPTMPAEHEVDFQA